MKKLLLFLIIFISFVNITNAWYKLEKWSLDLVNKYNFSTKNLDKQITRKEFVETLYVWYKDYKKDRWVNIGYDNYRVLDNSKIFTDIDLNSDFGKKLSYFAWLWAFSKNQYFNPNGTLDQNSFFIVMSRLNVMYWLQNCKYHRICEKEADVNNYFLKWTYYKYVSKILDRKLRKYYNRPSDYINAWYKSYLSPNYRFPLVGQTLNWCYAFSIRNILKYKHWIGIYVSKAEKVIWKLPARLWNYSMMKKFDNVTHVEARRYYHIDTFINSLQAWDPLAITYYLDYYSWKEKRNKQVLHIVAAYSFDANWVWVAETVSAQRKLVPWNKVFNIYWTLANRRMFKYYYDPKQNWTSRELEFERKNNVLAWEY